MIWTTPTVSVRDYGVRRRGQSAPRCAAETRSCEISRTTSIDLVHDLRNATQSSPASCHLDATSRRSPFLLHQSIPFQTCRHRVCQKRNVLGLVTRIPERGILVTSANLKIIMADVDSTCNVRTLLVDADGACCLQIGIRSPLRARSSIFVRSASLVASSCATKSARSFLLCLHSKSKITRLRLTPNSELSCSCFFGIHAS